MKTTLDIPDALYRAVKSRSAGEGISVRGITIMLYGDWLSKPDWKPSTAIQGKAVVGKTRRKALSPLTRSLVGIAKGVSSDAAAKDEYFADRFGMSK